jgi:type VI protein secretion system component Hcp
MASNGADIYMILLRPTRVPVAGESVSHLFQGQVLLESLEWNLHNEEERVAGDVRDDMFREKESLISTEGSVIQQFKTLKGDVTAAQASLKRAMSKVEGAERDALQEKHDRLIRDSLDKFQEKYKDANAAVQRQSESKGFDERVADKRSDMEGRNPNFEFKFKKRVDIATTQMLNSMKAGDIFPSGTLTIHKRSTNVIEGTSLVFTIQKIRLLEYSLEVAVTDTMTEMMEEWTCEFGSLAYVYKNPPSHYSHGNAGQAVVKTATQATMRAFTMKNIGSPV